MTAPPEPRKRVSRQAPAVRREDLLKVTLTCLAQLGPRGTTGREICRRAGVSHGLLRHYFRNPDNLLFETYEELCDHFLARFEAELLTPDADPREAGDRHREQILAPHRRRLPLGATARLHRFVFGFGHTLPAPRLRRSPVKALISTANNVSLAARHLPLRIGGQTLPFGTKAP